MLIFSRHQWAISFECPRECPRMITWQNFDLECNKSKLRYDAYDMQHILCTTLSLITEAPIAGHSLTEHLVTIHSNLQKTLEVLVTKILLISCFKNFIWVKIVFNHFDVIWNKVLMCLTNHFLTFNNDGSSCRRTMEVNMSYRLSEIFSKPNGNWQLLI